MLEEEIIRYKRMNKDVIRKRLIKKDKKYAFLAFCSLTKGQNGWEEEGQ